MKHCSHAERTRVVSGQVAEWCPHCGAIFNGDHWQRPHHRAHHPGPGITKARPHRAKRHHTGRMPPALARYWRTHKRKHKGGKRRAH